MLTVNQVRTGFYLDSVALMRIAARLKALPGVDEAALMIGTESNKEILAAAGLLAAEGRAASVNDLIVGVRAASQQAASDALAAAQDALDTSAVAQEASAWRPKSLAAAASALPGANLALVSVPGEFAAREARKALRRGLNVLIFSDNVPLEQERALKEEAREQGLLVMGPDCGTAFISGVPLAFANAIPQGEIGVIAASGTGLQEFSVLVARAGQGLSHGIGVGGRDLSDAIGAISTLTALDLLEQDPATRRIVLISKPPGAQTAARVMQRLQACAKPVGVCFIGYGRPADLPAQINFAATLREAAEQALGKTIGADFAPVISPPAAPRRWLRGLFTGGTLCAEAQVLAKRAGLQLEDKSGHHFLDLGADEYTVGRPHPMIEPAVRNQVLQQALRDPEIAAILLDVVLGYGAHLDPAGSLAATLAAAPPARPFVVASVCGVDGDPQGYREQVHKLQAAGVIVAPSNAQAAKVAIRVVVDSQAIGSK